MKTEQRHKLHSNELAQLISSYQFLVKPYLTWIVGTITFLAVLWIALGWMRSSRDRQLTNSWTEFVQSSKARDLERLRGIATKYPRTPAAARALYEAGNIALHGSVGLLLTDRAEGIEMLRKAKDDFEAALACARKDEFLTPQVLLGIAQVHESLNELDAAKDQYKRIIDGQPATSFAETARQRLDFLNQSETVAFANWLAEQKIEIPMTAKTSGQTPRGPGVNDDLPMTNDFLLPDADALDRARPDSDLGPMIPPTEGTDDSSGPSLDLGPILTPIETAPGSSTAPDSSPAAPDRSGNALDRSSAAPDGDSNDPPAEDDSDSR